MLQFSSKYTIGKDSGSNNSKSFKNIQLGIVTTVGKVEVNNDTNKKRAHDTRFNADDHVIRCRIIGSEFDNKFSDSELANCFPLLPKHLNFVPKINEVVLVITLSEGERFNDRFYIGPINSSPSKLDIDTIDTTALSNFADGNTTPAAEISKIPSADGIYADPQNVVIQGRQNTDIIQKDNEVLIRSGKFIYNNPLAFNKRNPAYIQLKFNQSVIDADGQKKTVSVNNIVANKINLLTYDGGKPAYNLTNVDGATRQANYISDDELNNILQTAHPLVFGDTLIQYLKLLKRALINHVHNGNGNKATDRTDGGGTLPLEDFLKSAERLEKEMLSNNIRIN